MRGLMRMMAAVWVAAWGWGCEASQRGEGKLGTAAIQHVVLVKLVDARDTQELMKDGRLLLSTIPSVRSFACGSRVDTGRGEKVSSDYDVGYVFGFEDAAGYMAYEAHPQHRELLERWKSRVAGMRIFDFGEAR